MSTTTLLTEIKKYIIHFAKHKRTEFVYAIFVILLTIIAIYSVYSVLYDYVYNNTMTTVKMNTTDNILPFLPYFSVYYYFYPLPMVSGRSIIPKTWSLSDSEILSMNLFPIGPHASNALARIAERKNEVSFYRNNSTDLSLDSQCDIATINALLQELDRNFWMSGESISQITPGRDNDDLNGGKVMSVNFSDVGQLIRGRFQSFNESIEPEINAKLLSIIDSFAENSYGNQLVDKVLSTLTPFKYLQLETNEYVDLPVTYFSDELSNNQATVSVQLDFFANKTKRVRKWPIVFGFMPPDYQLDKTNYSSAGTENVQLFFSPIRTSDNIFRSYYYPSSSTQYTQLDITVKNFGIYNTTEVRDDCEICGNFTSVDDCIWKCKLNILVDVCQCIPFVTRRWVRSDPKRRHLPRCTFQHYANCSKSDKFNATHCDPDKFKPCVISRNNYVVDVSYPVAPKTKNTPKIIFRFTFDEKTYVIYQDEYQNSLMQMLGTLGGNLGVFLSFSLLGVWQFCVFVHFTCTHRIRKQRPKSTSPPITRTHGIISSWLRMAQLNAETQLQMHNQPSTQDLCQKTDLEEAKKEIDALRDVVEKQRQETNNEIEKAKIEREEFRLFISFLEKRLQTQEDKEKQQIMFT